MRAHGSVLAWLLVAGASSAAAEEPFTARFAIEGQDSAGVAYSGTLELRGEHVRRRVRLGERWLEHRGRGTLEDHGATLVLRATVASRPGREAEGLAGALDGARAGGPAATASLRVVVRRDQGRVEARLESPGYTADDRGALAEPEQRRYDLAREVRSDLPPRARLHLRIEVDAGAQRIDEAARLLHQEAGGELLRSWEQARVGGRELDVAGITERLQPAGPSWESGLRLLERAGGQRATRRALEGSQLARTLLAYVPARVLLPAEPVAPGEPWALDPGSLLAVYKVDRIDPARSRVEGRLVGVEETAEGARYRVALRVELAVLAMQGAELEPGSTLALEHQLVQTPAAHEFLSAGRLQGRLRGGPALDQHIRTRFAVDTLP